MFTLMFLCRAETVLTPDVHPEVESLERRQSDTDVQRRAGWNGWAPQLGEENEPCDGLKCNWPHLECKITDYGSSQGATCRRKQYPVPGRFGRRLEETPSLEAPAPLGTDVQRRASWNGWAPQLGEENEPCDGLKCNHPHLECKITDWGSSQGATCRQKQDYQHHVHLGRRLEKLPRARSFGDRPKKSGTRSSSVAPVPRGARSWGDRPKKSGPRDLAADDIGSDLSLEFDTSDLLDLGYFGNYGYGVAPDFQDLSNSDYGSAFDFQEDNSNYGLYGNALVGDEQESGADLADVSFIGENIWEDLPEDDVGSWSGGKPFGPTGGLNQKCRNSKWDKCNKGLQAKFTQHKGCICIKPMPVGGLNQKCRDSPRDQCNYGLVPEFTKHGGVCYCRLPAPKPQPGGLNQPCRNSPRDQCNYGLVPEFTKHGGKCYCRAKGVGSTFG